MENGNYKASLVKEVSTEDWIRLNFDTVDQQLLVAASPNDCLLPGEDYEAVGLEVPDEPEEPDGGEPDAPDEADFNLKADYEKAHATYLEDYEAYEKEHDAYLEAYDAYEEADREVHEAEGLPMWNTMWVARETHGLAETLTACGFSVYQFLSGTLDAVFDGTLVFGVDGAGYSFYGAHWIPLRTLILKQRNDAGYMETSEYQEAIELLLEQAYREGDRSRVEQILTDKAA